MFDICIKLKDDFCIKRVTNELNDFFLYLVYQYLQITKILHLGDPVLPNFYTIMLKAKNLQQADFKTSKCNK